ncbi:Holliday junction branch migration protein RuvA [Lachnobacterium bovis]|uniref:Holliday junction branch migration protein RuvA n=1 Tax=Lachnobacterium bovis TaxID=140626 RepID=UPI0003B6E8F0|nr:Holliday junction branch migration protein RuvA [Lachnobacterium bovis]
MYRYIRGQLEEIEASSIVVEAAGVGYNLIVSNQTLNTIPQIGQEVKIYTYLAVREDAMVLYGFCNKDELNVFKCLIGVNGVGPKVAIGILSAMTTNEIRFAIAAKDNKAISKAPGIGPKTAQRIILELQDKLKLEDALENNLDNNTASKNNVQMGQIKEDAILALNALGFSSTEALNAVSKVVITEGMESDDVLKAALKYM